MIRILENVENSNTNNINENDIEKYLDITLAGLNDNINYQSVDTSEFPYVTVEYYFFDEDQSEDIYLGTWDFDFDLLKNMSENDRIMYLDTISAEVDAAAVDFIDDVEN